jgi:acyl carrier protein
MPGLPADFEKLLRTRCTLLAESDPIDPDAPLWTLGVESIDLLGLIVDLETAYQLVFSDDLLVTATFDTAAAVWQAVQDLMAAESPHDAR